jgi:hypothetical protein
MPRFFVRTKGFIVRRGFTKKVGSANNAETYFLILYAAVKAMTLSKERISCLAQRRQFVP